jgi:hypothetical protein
MSPLIFAAGIRMMNELFLPERFQIADQQMMDDPVAKIGGKNFARLGVGNDKTD